MAGPGVLQQFDLGDAEARLVSEGVGRSFEFQQGPRVYRDSWDPRSDGAVLVVAPTRWSDPEGAPTEPATHDLIIDAFWRLARSEAGVKLILEWRPDLRCKVAHRWLRPDDGFLVDIGTSAIEYLELGRTLTVPFTRGTPSDPTAQLAHPGDQRAARWRFPTDREVSDAEWARVLDRIMNASSGDMVRPGSSWKIV